MPQGPGEEERARVLDVRRIALSLLAGISLVVGGVPPGGDTQGTITISATDVVAISPRHGTSSRTARPQILAAKVKAQEDAGRVDVNLLLTGQDAGSVLVENGQLEKLFPQDEKLFPSRS